MWTTTWITTGPRRQPTDHRRLRREAIRPVGTGRLRHPRAATGRRRPMTMAPDIRRLIHLRAVVRMGAVRMDVKVRLLTSCRPKTSAVPVRPISPVRHQRARNCRLVIFLRAVALAREVAPHPEAQLLRPLQVPEIPGRGPPPPMPATKLCSVPKPASTGR